MLAKMSWRILKFPSSLLARVLKGRYFKGGFFLEAPLGSNPSLTWRSIIWDRELFQRGYRWKIGKGNHIRIDKDSWIARKGSNVPMWIDESLKGKYVSTILKSNGSWKNDLIQDLFSIPDQEDIKNTVAGGDNFQDDIIWNYEDNDIFSVKSAYHLAIFIQNNHQASTSKKEDPVQLWKRFWKIKTIPKAKICVWKIIHDSIPISSNIRKKRNRF